MNEQKVTVRKDLIIELLKHNKRVDDDDEHYSLPYHLEHNLHHICEDDTTEYESQQYQYMQNEQSRKS